MGPPTSFPELPRPESCSQSFRSSNSRQPLAARILWIRSLSGTTWRLRALGGATALWALPGNSRLGEPGEPGRGEGSGGDAHAPCPGGGLRTPALLPAGRGGKARQGEARRERGREERGARKRGGGAASRPTPCLENNGFPLLPPAAHSAPHPALLPGPERGVGGAAAAGAVGTRADAYKNWPVSCQKTSSYFREARWASLVPGGVGHISPQPGDLPSTLKQRGISFGEAVGS